MVDNLGDLTEPKENLEFVPYTFLTEEARHELAVDLRQVALKSKDRLEELLDRMQKTDEILAAKSVEDKSSVEYMESKALQGLIDMARLALQKFAKKIITDDPVVLERLIGYMEDILEAKAGRYLQILLRLKMM